MDDFEVGQVDMRDIPEPTSGNDAPESISTDDSPEELESTSAQEGVDSQTEEPPDEVTEEGDPLDDLISTKYGGDKKKFVDGLHETWKSSSRLKKELDELRAQLASRPEVVKPEPEFTPPQEITDQIKWLEEQLTSLEGERVGNENRKEQILNRADQINLKLAKLEGKLEVVDDYAKAEIQQEISALRAEKSGLSRDYESLKSRDRSIGYEKRNFEQNKLAAERAVQGYKEQAKNQEVFLASKQKEIRDQFNQTFTKALDAHQFPKDPEFRSELDETIRAEISYYLSSLPPDAPAIDIEEETNRRVAKHARLMGLVKKGAIKSLTNQKVEGATKVSPKGTVLPKANGASNSSGKAWTPEQARALARKVLG